MLLTIFGTIAIGIAIAKDTSRLLLLVLLLLRGLSELLLLLLIAIYTIGQLWLQPFGFCSKATKDQNQGLVRDVRALLRNCIFGITPVRDGI